MKILLIGTGRMGRLMEEVAAEADMAPENAARLRAELVAAGLISE